MKVFDASAVLAVVFAESGAERAESLMEAGDAVIRSINHAEDVARLLERGMGEAEVDAVCEGLRLQALPFTASQAVASGRLRLATRPWACRWATVAAWRSHAHRGAQRVGADRPWKAPKGFRIALIR